MFRKGKPKPEHISVNIVINNGGLGDSIAAFPIFKIIVNKYTQNHHFIFWVPDYILDLAKFCFPKVKFRQLSDIGKRNQNLITFHTHIKYPSFLRTELTDFASILLLDTVLEPNEKNYLKPDLSSYGLPKHLKEQLKGIEKYIIITCMYTSPVRAFRGKEINKISNWCVENGYTPVFLGREKAEARLIGLDFITANVDEEIDYSKGINLINQTSLLDCLKLMEKSSCVIGLDNGLLHLACMTDVMVIGGFTTVHPKHRLPYRYNTKGWNYYTVNPDEELECRWCQSSWPFEIKQNFMMCYYGDELCTHQITGEKFIKILEEKLK